MQSLQKDPPQDRKGTFNLQWIWYQPSTTMQKCIKHAQRELITNPRPAADPLETSLICILLSASRHVHFDKRKICFLSGLL